IGKSRYYELHRHSLRSARAAESQCRRLGAAQERQVPKCVILGEDGTSAGHLCRCRALVLVEVADFSRDFAILFACNNEVAIGCTSVWADRSGKSGFSLDSCALIVPRGRWK